MPQLFKLTRSDNDGDKLEKFFPTGKVGRNNQERKSIKKKKIPWRKQEIETSAKMARGRTWLREEGKQHLLPQARVSGSLSPSSTSAQFAPPPPLPGSPQHTGQDVLFPRMFPLPHHIAADNKGIRVQYTNSLVRQMTK